MNLTDLRGRTPLLVAAGTGNHTGVVSLLALRADPMKTSNPDPDGNRPNLADVCFGSLGKIKQIATRLKIKPVCDHDKKKDRVRPCKFPVGLPRGHVAL
jgi:hypothetical protein